MNNFNKSLGGLVLALSLNVCGNKAPEEVSKISTEKECYGLIDGGQRCVKKTYNDTETYYYDSKGNMVLFLLDGRGLKKESGGDGTIEIVEKIEYNEKGHKTKEIFHTICYEKEKAYHFHTRVTEYEISSSGYILSRKETLLPIETNLKLLPEEFFQESL